MSKDKKYSFQIKYCIDCIIFKELKNIHLYIKYIKQDRIFYSFDIRHYIISMIKLYRLKSIDLRKRDILMNYNLNN